MTVSQIEKRLTALEAEVASLKSTKKKPQSPWWDKIAGVFADNPRFDRAMRAGRESQEPRPSKPQRSIKQTRASRKAAK